MTRRYFQKSTERDIEGSKVYIMIANDPRSLSENVRRSYVRHASIVLCLLVAAAPIAAAPAPSASPASASQASAGEEMSAYLSKAQDAADSNHLAEAIRSYVTVLAIADENPSPDAKAKADRASAELARIGTSLTLEPASEWVDPKGTQIAGSSRSLGKEGGLSPAVYLFENFGMGKSPVGRCPRLLPIHQELGIPRRLRDHRRLR